MNLSTYYDGNMHDCLHLYLHKDHETSAQTLAMCLLRFLKSVQQQHQRPYDRSRSTTGYVMVHSQLESTTIARSLLLLLLLLLQALHLHCLKVLTFSTTSFHLTRSWMYLIPLFIFIILKSSFISFSHLTFWSSCQSCRHRFPLIQFLDHSIIYREVTFLTKSATDTPAVAKTRMLCEMRVKGNPSAVNYSKNNCSFLH